MKLRLYNARYLDTNEMTVKKAQSAPMGNGFHTWEALRMLPKTKFMTGI